MTVSSFVVGAWFEFVSLLLEGFMGIHFTDMVVAPKPSTAASKPSTAASTAETEASKKSVEDVDTSFLTKRRVEGDSAKTAEKITKAKDYSAKKSGDFVDGMSPNAQKVLNLSEPQSAVQAMCPPTKGKVNIIVLNHRCRLDWMMIWPLLVRSLGKSQDTLNPFANSQTNYINPPSALKITQKLDMAWIPLLGYCIQIARTLFLKRRWEEDQEHLVQYMRYLHSDVDEQTNILIFPEGTDFFPEAIKRSHKWSKENDKPQYNHVLHPRTTGILAMKNAIGTENIESIIDVTIAYADRRKGDRTNDVHLIGDLMPKEISFLVEKFVFDGHKTEGKSSEPEPYKIPTDDLGFRDWLEARWAQKEADVASYYKNGTYGWDVQKDIEGSQWTDGKGETYDRFVVGGNYENSLFNTPNKTKAGGIHQNGHKIGTVKSFIFNTILAGGFFGGNGSTASVWTYGVKPFLLLVPVSIYFGIYVPFLAASWWPFILTHLWIAAFTVFFVGYLQKKNKKTFDQMFLFPEMDVPEAVIEAEKKRESESNIPPVAPKAAVAPAETAPKVAA
eukprot:GILI01017299.1.p1 GENE.GILI01017299.1~~GILI01017299.1.p1  ORF type:complete len:641 (+),score=149.48 GILI01017299.1:247-1923(+)